MRFAIPCLTLVLVAAACGSTTGPLTVRDFRIESHDPAVDGPVPALEAEGTTRAIDVVGGIQTSCSATAGQFEGTVDQQGDVVTLHITLSPGAASCPPGMDAFRYTATVGLLQNGGYTLRVVHTLPGMPDEVALETTVLVL